jgi:hypothetical protein
MTLLTEAIQAHAAHQPASMEDPFTEALCSEFDDIAAGARQSGACSELQAKVEADVAYATGIDWGLVFVTAVAVGAVAAALFQVFPMGFALELP